MILLDWALPVWLHLALRRNEALRLAVVRMSRSRCCNTHTGTRCKVQSRRKSEPDDWDIPIQRLLVSHGDVSVVVCAIWLSCFGTISVRTKPQIQFLYEFSEQYNLLKEFRHSTSSFKGSVRSFLMDTQS